MWCHRHIGCSNNEQTEEKTLHHWPIFQSPAGSYPERIAISTSYLLLYPFLFYFVFSPLSLGLCLPVYSQCGFSSHRNENQLIWVWINHTTKWWLKGVCKHPPITFKQWCVSNLSNYASAPCSRHPVFVQNEVQWHNLILHDSSAERE